MTTSSAAADHPMLSAPQLHQFETEGATIVDLRLSPQDLAAAEAVWDRNVSPTWEDPEWIRLMAQPCFENIAKQVLRSDKVYILETGRASPGNAEDERALSGNWPVKHGIATEWANAMHTDNQETMDDFEATPRRTWLAIWFWLNDVPAERAAMRVLPGSHLTLMKHYQEMQALGKAGKPLPVRQGPRWVQAGEPDALWFSDQEPKAMAAPAGHAQVFTQCCLHAGWHRDDPSAPRKGMHVSWVAEGVPIGGMRYRGDKSTGELSPGRVDSLRDRSRELRKRLPADRRHIAMSDATISRHDMGGEYHVEKWPPTMQVGLGRIIALYYCPSTLYQNHYIFGTSISETKMRPNPTCRAAFGCRRWIYDCS
jgi:hypothetical protein